MKFSKFLKEIFIFLNSKYLYHGAASLSFYTLLAIVPFAFIAISLYLNLDVFKQSYLRVKEFIFANLLPNNQAVFMQYFDEFMRNSASLGLFGLVAIFVTSVFFFMDYNYVANKIINGKNAGFLRGVVAFFLVAMFLPVIIATSLFASGFVIEKLGGITPTINSKFALISPFLIIWLIFGCFYYFTLGRKMSAKIVFFCAFISSILWEIGKILFIKYMFYNKTYTNIYGSFSVLFFFFMWIYISWIIYLFGLKICALAGEIWCDKSADFSAENLAKDSANTQNKDAQ